MMYLPVGDLVESIRRVEAEGGEVIKAVRGEEGKYVYAAVSKGVTMKIRNQGYNEKMTGIDWLCT
jgi:predicted enzyme related to lactoylglutathione lyase